MCDQRSRISEASPWVMRFLSGAVTGGTALDVACGGGRHLALCLASGLSTVGIDQDVSSAGRTLRGEPNLELIRADLENGESPPFAGRVFDVVIVTNYLWRPLLPAVVSAVSDRGLLIYETFARGNEALGRPANPAFLLRPDELIDAVRPRLSSVAFEHVRLEGPSRIVQRICAVGARHPWLVDGGPAH